MNTNVKNIDLSFVKGARFVEIFFQILKSINKGKISVKTPNGEYIHFVGEKKGSDVSIHIKNWSFCEKLILKGDIGLGESYINGDWECEQINDLIKLGIDNYRELEKVIKGSLLRILFYRFKHYLNRNTKEGSRKNIHAHYDLGNEFYKLWLDRTMTYSSAIFKEGDEDLEIAQKAKYQRIIDELGVKPGDHILEIGCGWGGFMQHSAELGIKVTGVTISQEQYQFAKQRTENFGELCNVLLKDYRELDGQFDHIVSIEMFEALGKEYWNTYFNKVNKLLSNDGKALIQTITIRDEDFKSYSRGSDFIQQYIFPGGMLPSPKLFGNYAKKSGLVVASSLDFGTDYGKTLKIWDEIFMDKVNHVKAHGFDDSFIKTWHFYLKYCQGGFEAGKLGVSQYLLEKKV